MKGSPAGLPLDGPGMYVCAQLYNIYIYIPPLFVWISPDNLPSHLVRTLSYHPCPCHCFLLVSSAASHPPHGCELLSKVRTGSIGRQHWKITLVKILVFFNFPSFSLSMPTDPSDLHVPSTGLSRRKGYIDQ